MHAAPTRSPTRGISFATLSLLLAACGGSGAGPAGSPTPAPLSEAAWHALATPRPAPLPGAPRVSVDQVQILAQGHLGLTTSADVDLGVSELVAAGLLRRQDVEFIERRRFAAAAEAERRGQARAPGAPPVGTSQGAEFMLDASWASLGLDSAYLDVRLRDAGTNAVVGTRRVATPNDADPTSLARSVVGALLGILDHMKRHPAWNDPIPASAPASYQASGVPLAAVNDFLQGLSSEDRWDWELARAGYQAALATGGAGFFEARAALARTARLRLGGTLGAS